MFLEFECRMGSRPFHPLRPSLTQLFQRHDLMTFCLMFQLYL